MSTIYVLTPSFVKNDFFLSYVKKDKEMYREKLFLSTKLCLFCTRHKTYWFLAKQLYKHIEFRHVCVNFRLIF
jgi:hypothetical protein